MVKVTGAIEAEGAGRGGMMAVDSSYWRSPEDRAKKGAMFRGYEAVMINCNVPDLTTTIEVSSSGAEPGATATLVPFKPQRYDFEGIQKKAPKVHVMATLQKRSIREAAGTVDVTEFDGRHIAGTFHIRALTMPGDAPVTIDGTFAFKCPGLSGCDK